MYAWGQYWVQASSGTDMEYAPVSSSPAPRLVTWAGAPGRENSGGPWAPVPTAEARELIRRRIDSMRWSGQTSPDEGLDVRSLERVLASLVEEVSP